MVTTFIYWIAGEKGYMYIYINIYMIEEDLGLYITS